MTTDVLIAGGGPNGLLLACELALAGVRPVVLERLPEPTTEPRANGLVGQVVQLLDYRGLFQRFSGAPRPTPVPGYQFGGLMLDARRLDPNPLYVLPVPQRRMEQLLEARARELGVEIRREHEVTGLAQDDDGVTVEVRTPGGDRRLRARYLVGADGGRSLVRRLVGIDFPGITDDTFVSRSGTVAIPASHTVPGTGEITGPGLGRLRPFTFNRTPAGVFAFGMFQPGVYRITALEWNQPEAGPEGLMEIDELRAAVGRVLGADVPMTVAEAGGGSAGGGSAGGGSAGGSEALRRRPGINSRQADRYRAGRVFLVGDAAHVHSGVGGPGLNLGMQDAVNLGWKLAAQVRGWAPPGLLDTYGSERQPVGERVIMHTRAQMALLTPGDNVTALRDLFGELLADVENIRRIVELMSGAEIRYGADPYPLVGRWMPDLPLRGPVSRVAELFRTARPVLLDLAGGADLRAVADPWTDRVDVVRASSDTPPADAVLIRPDGYVAWAGGADATAALEHALTRWFGDATPAPAAAVPAAGAGR
jgi:2-polyprenyl-6-methoxyphenol hydroxylase-like FAD-dependent oxidoreductase